jgi:hypothetical protein
MYNLRAVGIVACRYVSKQRFGKHVSAVTDTHATIEVTLESEFSTRSVQRGVTRRASEARIDSWKGAAVEREPGHGSRGTLLEVFTRKRVAKTQRAGKHL